MKRKKQSIKKFIRLALLGLFISVSVFLIIAFIELRQRYIVPILMYHSVTEASIEEGNLLVVSAKTFQKQMEFLRTYNYNVISLAELVRLKKENLTISRKTVVITFDDGYRDNFLVAFPILKRYNIPATIFVAPLDISADANYLTWPEVKKLSDSSLVEIGSHGLNQAYLMDIKDKRQLLMQIEDSKKILEDILQVPVRFFSYPAGGFNTRIRQVVIDSNYTAAVATKPGILYPRDDIFALKRLRISENNKNLFIFWVKLTGYYLPLREWQRRHKDKDIYYRITNEE